MTDVCAASQHVDGVRVPEQVWVDNAVRGVGHTPEEAVASLRLLLIKRSWYSWIGVRWIAAAVSSGNTQSLSSD